MGFLKRRFEGERISLSEKDETLIYEQLRRIDENKLELFSYISLLFISIMIVLDIVYFNEKFRSLYLFFDSVFWLISLSIIVLAFITKTNEKGTIKKIKKTITGLFPLIWFIWGTAICAFDSTSILNIITFYFIIFLFAFSVFSTLKKFLLNYLVIAIEFILIKLLTDQPLLTEYSVAMIIVCVLIIPFYYSFRRNRINSQAALNMLREAKKNLEEEVAASTRELLMLNSNMKDEIRQRKIVESKIRETLKLAESNNQLKSEFLANISHEIRTPLNAIIGFSEMLTEESVSFDRKKEFQHLIETNTGYLLSTIDDIFDASLIRTDQINPVEKPFRLSSFIRGLTYDLNSIALKYDHPDIELLLHPWPDEELMVLTDEYYLRKAILRLADNAYKFTKQGKVEIGIREENGRLEFFVSDTGIGIPEKDALKIFEPFVQGNGTFTRNFGGSGLGLTLAKGIATALGATLSYTSVVGEGSTFIFSFPSTILQTKNPL